MRLFIGIKVSPKIEELAQSWQENKQDWPVRWLKPANLHLTLVPPFYQDSVEAVAGRLAQIEKPAWPVRLPFYEISYGPRPGGERLIWATARASPELENLKIEMERKLDLKSERRNFLVHLTLARFRPEDFARFKVKKLAERIDWLEEVNGFAIFESVLTPAGAEYRILKSF
jgi:2'-5' RNA ligase